MKSIVKGYAFVAGFVSGSFVSTLISLLYPTRLGAQDVQGKDLNSLFQSP